MRQRIKSAKLSDNISLSNSYMLVEDARTGKQFKVRTDTFINGGGTKRVYKALLSQVEEAAPTAVILENTIGNIVWTRTGVGSYIGTLANAFIADKTFLLFGSYAGTNGQYLIYVFDINTIQIYTIDSTGQINTDSLFNNTSIHIEVYS